jgi:dUTP pyrophosphatase
MLTPTITFRVWRQHPQAVLPARQHVTDIGFDLALAERVTFLPGEWQDINLGIVVEPPVGYYFELVPRSSLFHRFGLLLVNSVGIIDPTYCGETDVLHAQLLATRAVALEAGTRVLQLVPRALIVTNMIDATGSACTSPPRGGLGSTGV